MSNEAPDMAREYEQECFGCGEKVWWVEHADTGVSILRNADGTEHACRKKNEAA